MNKLLKGQLLLAMTLSIGIYACAPKAAVTPTPSAVPTAQSVTPINPDDLNIPGITDEGTGEEVTEEETTEEETPTEEPSASTAPSATATPAPTDTTSATATPSPTPTPVPTVTCEVKVEGDLTVAVGSERDLTGKIACTDSSSKDESNITFSSANTDIATVESDTGVVKGIKKGTAKIIAYQTSDTTIKTEVTVTVTANCTISLTGTDQIYIGSSNNLLGKVSCTGQSDNSEINWTTSDSSVATVSTSGSVSGLKEGTVTIEAIYKNDPSIKASKIITIKKAPDARGNENLSNLGDKLLFQPRGIDVRNGNIYVADYDNGGTTFDFNLVDEGQIQILNTSGIRLIDPIQGSSGDSLPIEVTGIVSDSARVWVANRVPYAQAQYNIYSYTTSGSGRTNSRVGQSSGSIIKDLAIDPSVNTIYVADQFVKSVSRYKYDSSGKLYTPTDDGITALYFGGTNRIVEGLCLDDSGNIFFTDSSPTTPIVRKYSKTGVSLFDFNSTGKNGAGPVATKLGDIAFDGRNGGMIYVLAEVNGVKVILRYDWEGNFIRSFGSGTMQDPRYIAVGSDGTIYVTDYAKNVIVQFSAGI